MVTVVQYETESATLALAFPWRISVVLVPLASAAVLGGGATMLCLR